MVDLWNDGSGNFNFFVKKFTSIIQCVVYQCVELSIMFVLTTYDVGDIKLRRILVVHTVSLAVSEVFLLFWNTSNFKSFF